MKPTTLLEAKALAAFAEPVHAHAREYAGLVFAAIVKDVRDKQTESAAAGLAEVDVDEEYLTTLPDREKACPVPAGADEWQEREWCGAFRAELKALEKAAAKARRDAGAALLRQHARGIDRSRGVEASFATERGEGELERLLGGGRR